MPFQNRVDPFSRIHAVPMRGLFMGNRGGCFHRADQTLKPTQWSGGGWISCLLEFKDRKRELMQPNLYTELFFFDETVALAAGHRPCFECRRRDAKAWITAAGVTSAKQADAMLQAEMKPLLSPRPTAVREACNPATLPDFAFFAVGETAYLKQGRAALPFTWQGYGHAIAVPRSATRLTPKIMCTALANGFRPILHDSAGQTHS